MIATKSMTYGGKRLQPGDPFEPKRARDAKILRAIGKARDADDPAPEVQTVDAEPKRTYRRKDMKAEG